MKAIEALARRPPTSRELRERQQEFWYATAPHRKLLADIEAVTIHKYLIGPEGFTRIDNYTPETQEMRCQIFQMIDDLRRQIFEPA